MSHRILILFSHPTKLVTEFIPVYIWFQSTWFQAQNWDRSLLLNCFMFPMAWRPSVFVVRKKTEETQKPVMRRHMKTNVIKKKQKYQRMLVLSILVIFRFYLHACFSIFLSSCFSLSLETMETRISLRYLSLFFCLNSIPFSTKTKLKLSVYILLFQIKNELTKLTCSSWIMTWGM